LRHCGFIDNWPLKIDNFSSDVGNCVKGLLKNSLKGLSKNPVNSSLKNSLLSSIEYWFKNSIINSQKKGLISGMIGDIKDCKNYLLTNLLFNFKPHRGNTTLPASEFLIINLKFKRLEQKISNLKGNF
jgi:hypothetical protein